MICSQCAHAQIEPLETLSHTTLTRIKELLESNVAPHGREKEQLSEIMSRTQTLDVSLDTQIGELNASLENLQAQQKQTKQRLLDLQNVLHPQRYIPPEILADIFQHAVSDAMDTPLDTVRDGHFVDSLTMTAPHWVVSHVSSHWRRTALTTPRLWRFVHVAFDRHPINLSTSMFLNHFLRLSAEHTLHVMAHTKPTHSTTYGDAIPAHAQVSVLLLSLHRWRTAALCFPSSVYRCWNVARLTFTALVRLHVNIHLPRMTIADLQIGGYSCVHISCPQLRILSSDTPAAFVTMFGPQFLSAPLMTVFEQPDCLDVDLLPCGDSNVAPNMILNYPLLHSAQFHLTTEVSNSFYNRRQYKDVREYPNLRVLRLSGTHTGRSHFFSRFSFPRLEELSFDDIVKDFGINDTLSFPDPLEAPTGQELKTLKVSLDADPCERRKLIAFLRTTPALSHLELTFRARYDIDSMIKSILVETQDLIPALSRLILIGKEGVDVSLDFVRSISHRRFGGHLVARLDEVVVDYVVYIDERVEDAFNALLSGGSTGTLKMQ